MNKLIKKAALPAAIFAVLASPSAFATNGMHPTGLGQVHKAMGGTVVANPVNTMSMATNPAAAAFIDDGWDVGLEVFQPQRTTKLKAALGGAEFDGDSEPTFYIPEGGYKKTINDKHSVGVAVYGAGGMNTEYATNPLAAVNTILHGGSGGTNPAGIDLQQLTISPTWATKVNEKTSFGISANLTYQIFKATGFEDFDAATNTENVGSVTGNGYDKSTGIGLTLGLQRQMSDTVMAGIAYKAKTKMTKFDKYSGLFANAGEFDLPARLDVGVAWQATPKTQVAMDVTQIYYSDIDAIGNPAQGATTRMGGSNAPGFGWDDMTTYKLGIKQQVKPKLALMAGYNHGKSPIEPEDTFFGAAAPGVVEDHLSLGFEYKLSRKSSLVGSFTHAFENEVEGDLAGAQQPFDISMKQNAFGIGYSKKF